MPNLAHEPSGTAANMLPSSAALEWRSRYDGLVAIAMIGDKAIAGISGPWSGKFALTWWERPLPARQLELYDSMDDAKREVEDWEQRIHAGGFPAADANRESCARLRAMPARAQADAHGGLLDRVRILLPHLKRASSIRASGESLDQLRRDHACGDTDLTDLHFAATE